jgi:hypothetical protein
MAFDRPYSVEEVQRILSASEHRPRPDVLSGTGPTGHAISLHTSERLCKFSRPGGSLPAKDSTFLISRNSLAGIVHEALNSPPGQRELKKLNDPQVKVANIRSIILRQGANFDIFVVYRPKTGDPQTSFEWASTRTGDGYIVDLFVQVYKISGATSGEIHIQTAYAKDFARTLGENILLS